MAGRPLRFSSATWMFLCESMGAAASGFGELATAPSVDAERREEYAKKAAIAEQLFELLPTLLGRSFEIGVVDEFGPDHMIRGDLQALAMLRAGRNATLLRMAERFGLVEADLYAKSV